MFFGDYVCSKCLKETCLPCFKSYVKLLLTHTKSFVREMFGNVRLQGRFGIVRLHMVIVVRSSENMFKNVLSIKQLILVRSKSYVNLLLVRIVL